jgi:sugar O-acyltransferase (sialic acid O-acetyltransferase NeuD family)
MKKKDLILVGGGGHAISLINLIERNKENLNIIGYTDNKKTNLPIEYIGNDKKFIQKNKFKKIILVMAIGSHVKIRSKLFKIYKDKKYNFLTIIDKSAVIGHKSKILEGSIIFPNSVIGPETIIEENVVCHSGSIIEHNSLIKNNSYIGPGAVVCGHSVIEENVLIGAKSCIIENIRVKRGCTLGAGAVLVKNFTKTNKVLLGIPAK